MERVATLSERLREQIDTKASIDELLLTVQMLQSELMHLKSTADSESNLGTVAIHIPTGNDDLESQTEEKIYLELQVDQELIEEELEQIRKSAQSINSLSLKNKKRIF